MCAVARDKRLTLGLDGCGENRPILFWKRKGRFQIIIPRLNGSLVHALKQGGKFRQSRGGFGGEIAPCLLDDKPIHPARVSRLVQQDQQLADCAVRTGSGKQDISVQKNAHESSPAGFAAQNFLQRGLY